MIILKISGRNINKFIKKLYDNNINLYKIKQKDNNNSFIYILKDNLDDVLKLGVIYDIEIIGKTGYLQYLELINKNIHVIISFIISVFVICFLSNLVFDINIISNNKDVREILLEELENEGIYKYSLKKDYEKLKLIKENILKKYESTLEWIEIEYEGVRCNVRLEERIINSIKDDDKKYNIVASKDAVIMDIKSSRGEVVSKVRKAVKKGDVIINGTIYFNDELKEIVGASGKVMGEVWYNVKVSYPLTYYEEIIDNNSKMRYSLKLFNKEINLFRKSDKVIKEKIFESKYVSLYKNEVFNVKVIDEVLTYDEAINKAVIKAREQVKNKLDSDEYIIYEKSLKVSLNDSKIVLDMFFSVCEDITGYERIEVND